MIEQAQFQSPWVLWALCLIPAFILWAWVERRKRAVLRFSAASLIFKQGRGIRPYLLWMLPALRITAFTLAIIALARPQEQNTRVKDL
ncbi:MAG: BatA domain-containing protein, partial [Archangium sp.]|nr:BatA domain-containing protein [Archangium sp.]